MTFAIDNHSIQTRSIQMSPCINFNKLFKQLQFFIHPDCGDPTLFESVKSLLESELPSEMIEWKRSYGRASKNVVIHPKFIPFDQEEVTASCSVNTLVGQSILHTYWTECNVRFLKGKLQ